VTPGADQPLDIGLHQQLQHRLGHGSQKISLTSLLQQLGQYQSFFGHRVLSRFGLKSGNSTLAARPDGHLNYAADLPLRTVRNSPTCVDVSYENRANLAPGFFDQVIRKYEGTRLGRQELLAEVLEDTPGALWNREALDESRREQAPALVRIVVAIDPAATS